MTEPLPKTAKGDRPAFFDDPAVDALVAMLLELAKESWVTRNRVALLEDAVAAHLPGLDIETHKLPPEKQAALDAARAEFVARLFRVIDRDR